MSKSFQKVFKKLSKSYQKVVKSSLKRAKNANFEVEDETYGRRRRRRRR
jgi:mRNA-degrading endonuclease RelE of RelBE toxin-antitoxin system